MCTREFRVSILEVPTKEVDHSGTTIYVRDWYKRKDVISGKFITRELEIMNV